MDERLGLWLDYWTGWTALIAASWKTPLRVCLSCMAGPKNRSSSPPLSLLLLIDQWSLQFPSSLPSLFGAFFAHKFSSTLCFAKGDPQSIAFYWFIERWMGEWRAFYAFSWHTTKCRPCYHVVILIWCTRLRGPSIINCQATTLAVDYSFHCVPFLPPCSSIWQCCPAALRERISTIWLCTHFLSP